VTQTPPAASSCTPRKHSRLTIWTVLTPEEVLTLSTPEGTE
jgi:hypothetical protein